MVAGKQFHHHTASTPVPNSNNAFDGYEIRSGMSVQDLKQLTAQRQCLEFWARNSPRQTTAVGDWGYVSSPSSTCSSSFSTSPPRQYSNNSMSCYQTSGLYSYAPRRFASDKTYVTCGGQVVSFMEGVVNAPHSEYQMDN